MEKIQRYFLGTLTVASLTFFQVLAGIRPVAVTSPNGNSVQIKDGKNPVFSSSGNIAAIIVVQPEGKTFVLYKMKTEENGLLSLSNGEAIGLKLAESYRAVTLDLIERTVIVTAISDKRYYIDFGWKASPKALFEEDDSPSSKQGFHCGALMAAKELASVPALQNSNCGF